MTEIKVQSGPVRDAATLVLLRDGANGVEVLMVRRQRGASSGEASSSLASPITCAIGTTQPRCESKTKIATPNVNR